MHQRSQTQTATGAAASFLRDIEASVVLPANLSAADAATAVTCTLTSRLTGGEAGDVLEALPVSVRALLRRCERHESAPPAEAFGRQEVLRRVADHLGVREPDAERIAVAVFSALRARLPVKEADDVASQLPKGLKQLWREAVPGLAAPEGGALAGLTPQVNHFVLEDIEQSGALPAVITGLQAFSAVMRTLEQWLSDDEARRVMQGVPSSVRSLIERFAVQREGRPRDARSAEEFALRVAEHLNTDAAQAEEITRAVFAAVQRLMSDSEIEQVARDLPEDLQEMWRFPRPEG